MVDCNLLLETLSRRIGCTYLSDLHEPANRRAVLQAVRQIPAGKYSTQAWNDAACYITREQCDFENEETARNFLMEYCQR